VVEISNEGGIYGSQSLSAEVSEVREPSIPGE